jgi:hypothetical protein
MDFGIRVATAADVSAMHRVRTRTCENCLSSPERISHASNLPYVSSLSIWLAESPQACSALLPWTSLRRAFGPY